HRHVHDLADFLRVALAERSAEHGEVLREYIEQAAVDRARPGYDSVARDFLVGHSEVGRVMLDEHVIFFEAAGIEQHAQPLARGQPALGMLRRDALFAAAHSGTFAPLFELFDGGRQSSVSLPRLPSTRGSSGQSGGLANVALQHCITYVNSAVYCGTVTGPAPFIRHLS